MQDVYAVSYFLENKFNFQQCVLEKKNSWYTSEYHQLKIDQI